MHMRKFCPLSVLAVLLLILAGCGSIKPLANNYPKPKRSVRLMTYNVGAFGKYSENSTEMVATMIKELGADIVGLQELDSCNTRHNWNQVKALAEAVGNWNYTFTAAMDYKGGSYGVGIISKEKLGKEFDLHIPKGEGGEPRACSIVETPDFVYATTHLDHISDESRIAGAKIIDDFLWNRYKDSDKPVFLCGDMNSTPKGATIAFFYTHFRNLADGCPATYPSTGAKKCIDYIFCLRNKASVTVKGFDVPTKYDKADAAVASDHLPVIVDVKF